MTLVNGRRRAFALLGGLAAMAPASVAWAQAAPPYAQLLRQTQDSPRMAVLEADLRRAQALALQAAARPNPSLSVYAENFAGDSIDNARDQQQTTFQLDLPIELGGKRSARIAAGRAGVTAAQARGLDGRVVYAGELARAYAGAEIADRRVALALDEVEEAAADLDVAGVLVTAGKEARLRLLRAQTELDTMQASLASARAERAVALARLSALAGVSQPFSGVSESLLDRLDARPASGPPDPLRSTAFRAIEAEQEAAARAVAVQQRLAIPDLVAQVGIRQVRVASGPAIVAGLSVPLPLFDRNRGNIAAAQAELDGATARAAGARLEAQASAGTAIALVEAGDQRARAAEQAMATAEEAYRLARIAYQAGKTPLAELLATRHDLGTARGVILDAAVGRLDARIELARLQGLTITGEPVQ